MHELSQAMVGAQGSASEAESRARQASDMAARHATALDAVSQTSRDLAGLAERLQTSIARFSVDHRAATLGDEAAGGPDTPGTDAAGGAGGSGPALTRGPMPAASVGHASGAPARRATRAS